MIRKQILLQAKIFKGFADTSRLLILTSLSKKSKTVTEIVEETTLSQPNTSAHLACLVECGLIQKEKKGREVFYEITEKEVGQIISQVQNILKKHSKEIYNCLKY